MPGQSRLRAKPLFLLELGSFVLGLRLCPRLAVHALKLFRKPDRSARGPVDGDDPDIGHAEDRADAKEDEEQKQKFHGLTLLFSANPKV